MSLLQPHLKRALSLRSHLTFIEHQSRSFAFTADKSSQKILFLSSDGKIMFANKGALAILDRNDGLTIQGNRLRANNQRENARLDKLIREAAATAHGYKFGAGGCVSISRKAGPDIQLLITPLPMRISVAEGAAVVLFVIDPLNHVASRNELLQSAFGLTAAEARLACMLSSGLSIEDIAHELTVTRNTLKTQMRNLYSKMGVSKQHQLTSLVLQFPQ